MPKYRAPVYIMREKGWQFVYIPDRAIVVSFEDDRLVHTWSVAEFLHYPGNDRYTDWLAGAIGAYRHLRQTLEDPPSTNRGVSFGGDA